MERATQHELQLARRMSRLGTETAFEVLNKARALERQGKSIIHLEIGEPDFDTPANVIDAGVNALRTGWTHYGPAAGLPDLRHALAEYVGRTRGVKVSSDEVVVAAASQLFSSRFCH
jgi:aspartate aminotransferase